MIARANANKIGSSVGGPAAVAVVVLRRQLFDVMRVGPEAAVITEDLEVRPHSEGGKLREGRERRGKHCAAKQPCQRP